MQVQSAEAPLLHDGDAVGGPRSPVQPWRAKSLLLVADLVAVVVAITGSFLTQSLLRPVPADIVGNEILLVVVTLPVWFAAAASMRLYSARHVGQAGQELQRILQAVAMGSLFVLATGFFLHLTGLSRLWIGSLFVWVFVALALERTMARSHFRRLRHHGRLVRHVAIVGTNTESLRLAKTFAAHRDLGYEVVGFFGHDSDVARAAGAPLLGSVDDVPTLVPLLGIRGVIIAVTAIRAEDTNRLARKLTDEAIHVEISSALSDIRLGRFRLQSHGGHQVVYLEPTIRTGWRALAKRTFDVTFSAGGLLLAAPLLAVTALLIKLDSPGPVFFRQERVGMGGRRFLVLKLRTMVVDAEERKTDLLARNEADGPLFKLRDDPRITRVGRILRKFSVDEIPQFWNALRGDMSVVGPRPALASEMEDWTEDLHERLRVKPGLTGSWQVSGRSDSSFEDYQRLDLYYVDNWSLAHDLLIVAKTVPAVLASRGAA